MHVLFDDAPRLAIPKDPNPDIACRMGESLSVQLTVRLTATVDAVFHSLGSIRVAPVRSCGEVPNA
jgi:hypothetical protein